MGDQHQNLAFNLQTNDRVEGFEISILVQVIFNGSVAQFRQKNSNEQSVIAFWFNLYKYLSLSFKITCKNQNITICTLILSSIFPQKTV